MLENSARNVRGREKERGGRQRPPKGSVGRQTMAAHLQQACDREVLAQLHHPHRRHAHSLVRRHARPARTTAPLTMSSQARTRLTKGYFALLYTMTTAG